MRALPTLILLIILSFPAWGHAQFSPNLRFSWKDQTLVAADEVWERGGQGLLIGLTSVKTEYPFTGIAAAGVWLNASVTGIAVTPGVLETNEGLTGLSIAGTRLNASGPLRGWMISPGIIENGYTFTTLLGKYKNWDRAPSPDDGLQGVGMAGLFLLSNGPVKWVSMSGLGTYSNHTLRGLGMSGGVVSARQSMYGVMLGGALVGSEKADMNGVAMSLGMAYTGRNMNGFCLGGVGAGAGKTLNGVGIGGAGLLTENLHGFGFGGLFLLVMEGNLKGVGLAGTAGIVENEMSGLQVSGLFNSAKVQKGVSLTPGLNHCREANGLMLASVNLSQSCRGLQLGGFNRATGMRGMQIGLFNGSSYVKGVQLGLLNYNRYNAPGLRLLPVFNTNFPRKSTIDPETGLDRRYFRGRCNLQIEPMPPTAADSTGPVRVSGQVLAVDTELPLVGARIAIGDQVAFSNESGNFSLQIAPGEYDFTVHYGEQLKHQDAHQMIWQGEPLFIEINLRPGR